MKYCIVFLLSSVVFGLPKHQQTVNGEASFNISQDMEIKVSDRAILHWEEFSIAENETVSFRQPSESSSVLNRVVGSSSSKILGRLESNGKFMLINPNGIIFGKESVVQTASCIASTLDIHNEAFLDKKEWVFFGDSRESVKNYGTMKTKNGDLLLIGFYVQNHGNMEAGGEVSCIACEKVTIQPEGKKHLYIQARENSLDLENVYANAFEPSCRKQKDFHDSDVPTQLTMSGSIHAKDVTLLGRDIFLQDNALIDVSQTGGGGTVVVGGDLQGCNELLPNADGVKIDPKAVVRADALCDGDGGKIIIWSDGTTEMKGELFAEGGAVGGNGGFIEVSGLENLIFRGKTSTYAPLGVNGTLLLDPTAIEIANFASTVPGPFTPIYNPTGVPTAQIDTDDLVAALASSSVVISTTNGTGPVGSILLSDPISWSAAGSSLTLIANNDITINADIASSGDNAKFTFRSLNGNVIIGALPTQPARVTLTGIQTGDAITIDAPNGELLMRSEPGFRSHLHTRSLAGDTGNVVVTASGIRMICNSTNANPSNVEIYSFRGDVFLDINGDVYLEASEGNGVLQGGVQIVAGSDFANNPLGGNLTLNANNMICTADQTSTIGLGGVNVNSHRLLPTSPGVLNLSLSGDLLIESGIANNTGSGIASEGGPLNASIAGNCSIISRATEIMNTNGASVGIQSTTGPLSLSVGGDLLLQGGSPSAGPGNAVALVGSFAGGDVSVQVGGRTTMISGNPSASVFSGGVILSFGGNVFHTTNQLDLIGNGMGGASGYPFSFSPITNLEVLSSNDINMNFGVAQASNSVTLFAGHDMTMVSGSSVESNGPVQIIVDNQFPSPPFIGQGSFIIDETSFVTANGSLVSIYTARQGQNDIDPLTLLNGSTFLPGVLYVDTNQEMWCTYFPEGNTFFPFTLFYKDCLQLVTNEAMSIETEILWKFEKFRPTWLEEFTIADESDSQEEETRKWMLQRRSRLNNPRSWTDF